MARIDANADAIDVLAADGVARTFVVSSALVAGGLLLTADDDVVRIALESVLADARRSVSVGDTDGVGSALLSGAGVDAAPDAAILGALVDGQTDFAAGAIQVVTTRRNGTLASGGSAVAGLADALAVPAGRVRSALHGQARIIGVGLDGWLGSNGHAHHKRIAREAFLTLAVVTSRCVQADGISSASVTNALVDICLN